MKILVISQYFWPENFIINDLAKKLSDRGHEVVVATGKPNYPGGNIYLGYSRKGVVRETYGDTVEVIRVPMRPRKLAKSLNLSINYLSFVFSSIRWLPSLLKGRKFDVIFVFCVSPITAALPAIWLKKQTKSKVILWIQDLWPNSVIATGHVRSRAIHKALELIVRFIYRRADAILMQSQSFVKSILKLAPDTKIEYFPNFAPHTDVHQALPYKTAAHFDGSFCIVFTGNLGRAQSLGTIVDTAEHLRYHKNIRFLIAGTGSMAQEMNDALKAKNLTNVILLGELDRKFMPDLLKRADLLLVTLRDDPVLNLTIPSKLQAYMQAGRPIVGAVNGECARQIKLSKAGLAVPAEDSQGLAEIVLILMQKTSMQRLEMCQSAQAYFEENFEADKATDRLVNILNGVVNGKAV